MENTEQRYTRYLYQNKGVWFASCPNMQKWAEEKTKEGLLKPISSIVGNTNSNHWYVLKYYKEEDLLLYFTPKGLGLLFSFWKLYLDFQI